MEDAPYIPESGSDRRRDTNEALSTIPQFEVVLAFKIRQKGIPVTEKNVRAIVQKFLTAVENGDEKVLYEVYREDIQVWLNITNKAMSKQHGLAMLIGMRRAGVQLRYLLDEELIVGNKAVRRHRVEATMADGQTLTVHVAMFVTVEGDQIVQLDEYLDSREIAALPAAVHTKIKGDSASPA